MAPPASLLLSAGASAGGDTALCALAFHHVFAAGASYFGIADLATFRQQAPRFQAHQLDRLVGPTRRQSQEVFRADLHPNAQG